MAEPGFLKNRKMAEPMLKNVFICKYFKQLKEEPTTLSWLNSTCWPIYTNFRKVIKHNWSLQAHSLIPSATPALGRQSMTFTYPNTWLYTLTSYNWNPQKIYYCAKRWQHYLLYANNAYMPATILTFTYSISLTSPPPPITLWGQHYLLILHKKWNTNRFK